jgi:uncharacterized protein with HEPN domain
VDQSSNIQLAAEIICETARRLPTKLKARRQNTPWSDVAGAGNIGRHSDEDVLEQIL